MLLLRSRNEVLARNVDDASHCERRIEKGAFKALTCHLVVNIFRQRGFLMKESHVYQFCYKFFVISYRVSLLKSVIYGNFFINILTENLTLALVFLRIRLHMKKSENIIF